MDSIITPFGIRGWRDSLVAELLGYKTQEIRKFIADNPRKFESVDPLFLYVGQQKRDFFAYMLTDLQIADRRALHLSDTTVVVCSATEGGKACAQFQLA